MSDRRVNPCLKLFLVAVNCLFLIFGIVILAVGIYLCTSAEFGRYSEVLAVMETLRSLRLILIGCGCVIILIGLLGCLGSCKESRCPLIVYVILLIIIIMANVAAIVLAVIFTNEVKSYAVDQMKDSLKRFYGNETDASGRAFTVGVDDIQREERCCGWTGIGSANFYPSTPWYRKANANATLGGQMRVYPDSCCAVTGEKLERCTKATNETMAREFGYLHADDCWDRLMSVSGTYMHATIGTVVADILLQLICIVCAIILLRQISSSASGGIKV